jgi:NADH dehydrogenase
LHATIQENMAGSILVTGGSGFLGNYLLPRLAGSGRKLTCLGRRKPALQAQTIEFIPADLLDREACRRALQGCDTVVHLAAATGKCHPAEYFRINRYGTEAVVEEALRAGVERFLHISTIAAKFHDFPRYYYAQSKHQAETIVAKGGFSWTIVRPTIILGRASPVLEGLARLAALPILPVFGTGRALVQPIFVDDLAGSLTAILEDRAFHCRTIEVGGPEVLTIEELLLRIRRTFSTVRARVIHLPVGPLAACLGWVEPVLRGLLPVTAGQLASFVNDGTVEPDPCVTRWQAHMRGVDEMLQSLAKEHGSV